MVAYPPHRPVGSLEARAADLEAVAAGVPSLVLMEHAGRALAALAAELRIGPGPVVVLCGPGNNGGDGYACARFLASWGMAARILRFSGDAPRTGDARAEHELALRDLSVEEVARDDPQALVRAFGRPSLVVDALFGVGLVRALAPPYPAAIEVVNALPCPRLAADLPSGLDADHGVERPLAVRADVTAAMGLPKAGCFTASGARCAGRVVELDIGLPRAVHARFLRDSRRADVGRPPR